MSCSVGRRLGSDPSLLWLWHRLVVTALIGPLAWEPPYAAGVVQEIAKKTKKKKNDHYLITLVRELKVNDGPQMLAAICIQN